LAALIAVATGCAPDVGDKPPLFVIRGPSAEKATLNRTPWDIQPPQGTPKKPPEFSEGYFPCMDCHELIDTNPTKRKLEEEHTDVVLAHGINDRWCLDCHSEKDRNMLKLADGRLIPFEKAYRLCAQCHGEIAYEWSLGVHGKRTGNWNGDKEYYLCANCHKAHDPAHDPRIKGLQPKPAPMRPEKIGR